MAKKKSIFDEELENEGILSEEYEFLDEPEEHLELPEDFEMKLAIGEKEISVYTEEGISEELENDEIEPWEAGFMEGELHGGHQAGCFQCNKILDSVAEQIYAREVDGIVRFFCSQTCMDVHSNQ